MPPQSVLGRCNLPDDQRAALALRVLDRRTALAKSEQRKAAGAARAASAERDENGQMIASVAVPVGRPAGDYVPLIGTITDAKPSRPRIRAEVAKQASEKRIRVVAAIRNEGPDAYSAL